MKNKIVFLALIIFLAIGVTACNNQTKSDTLVLAVEKNPNSFDPLRGLSDSVTAKILQLIFDPLVVKDENFNIVPRLATYEHSPDYTEFTFKLKPGIKFQNGKPLTSADVKYTFNTIMDPNRRLPLRSDFSQLIRIDTPDPATVTFKFKEPTTNFLITLVAIGIMPEGSADTIATEPIGTGPFRRTAFVNTQYIDFVAFDEYFGGAPKVKSLRIRIVPDDSTRQLEFANGTIDLAVNTQFSPDTIESMRHTSGLQVLTSPGTRFYYLGLNTEDPVLKNKLVRQAIAHGLDRNIILKQIWHEQARRANSALPPEHWAAEPSVPVYEYDPARAMQLLDQAGYPARGNEPRLRLSLSSSSVALSRQVASIFQEQLRLIGIELDLEQFETQTFTDKFRRGQFRMSYANWVGANEDPEFLRFAYATGSIPTETNRYFGGNRSRYSNPEVDRLVAGVQRTYDQAKRKELYSQIQKIVFDDLPMIPLWFANNVAVTTDRVGGIKIDPSGSFYFIKDLTLDQ